MKKLLSFFLLLLCLGTGKAWADITVTLATNGSTSDPYIFGSRSNSNKTFTSNGQAGLEGLTLDVTGVIDHYSGGTWIGRLALKTNQANNDETFTITAPNGYKIIGYSFSATSTSSNVTHTITVNDTQYSINNEGYNTINMSGIYVQSTSFTVNSSSVDWIPVGPFTVTVVPDFNGTELIDENGTVSSTSASSTWFDTYQNATALDGFCLTCNKNNMQFSNSLLTVHSNNTPTYTLTAPTGKIVTGYQLSIYASESGQTITPDGKSEITISSSSESPTIVTVTDINSHETTFTRGFTSSGNNAYVASLKVAIATSYNISYSYTFNDEQVATETFTVLDGENYPEPTSIPFGYSCTRPEGSPNSDETKVIPLTWSLFSYADSYDNISQWYNVRMHSNQSHYLYYNSGTLAAAAAPDGNDYLWGFVGDPINGFQLYNYQSSEVAIDNNNPSTLSAEGKNVNFKVTSGTAGSNGAGAAAYFAMYVTEGSYLNYQGGQIKRWSSNDEGSTFLIDAATPITNYITVVNANIQPFINDACDAPFQISTSNASAMTTAIQDAQSSTSDGGTAITESEYNTLWATLQNHIQMPQTGYYRFKNHLYPTYYMNASASSLTGIEGNTDATTVVYLTNNNDGTYNIQMQGQYLPTPAQSNQASLTDANVSFTPTVVAPGWASFKTADSGEYGNLHMDSGKRIVGWQAAGLEANSASYWAIEAATSVTLSLNAGGDGSFYATLCLPFDVTLSGANAYTLTLNDAKTALNLSEAITTIPAGTPVLLKGDAATATATIASSASCVAAPSEETSLTGTYTDLTVTAETDYFLGTNGSIVGFYKWTGTTLKANRAYLPASTVDTNEVKGFALNSDTEVGIETLVTEEAKDSKGIVYNLAGQRVAQPTRGIYVVGGRKVVIK